MSDTRRTKSAAIHNMAPLQNDAVRVVLLGYCAPLWNDNRKAVFHIAPPQIKSTASRLSVALFMRDARLD